MDFTCRLAASLLLFAASLTSTALTASATLLIPESRVILAPLHKNNTLEFTCEVYQGATPTWKVDEHTVHRGNNDNIFVDTSYNISTFRIGDLGIRSFLTHLQGSDHLSLKCTPFTFSNGSGESEERLIVPFEAPGKPGKISVSRETGRIYWERPENMVSEVPLSFTVIVEDMASGRTDTYENVTKSRIKMNIPDCYSITLYAGNEAGTSEPSFLSSPVCHNGPVPTTMLPLPEPPTDTDTKPSSALSASNSGTLSLALLIGVMALLVNYR